MEGDILDGTSPLGDRRKKAHIPMIHSRADLQSASKKSSVRDTDEVSTPLFAPRDSQLLIPSLGSMTVPERIQYRVKLTRHSLSLRSGANTTCNSNSGNKQSERFSRLWLFENDPRGVSTKFPNSDLPTIDCARSPLVELRLRLQYDGSVYQRTSAAVYV